MSLPAAIGRYEVNRVLGRGAMGRVFLAHDPVLDRPVAIKALRDDLRIEPEQRQTLFERMRHEARASARVSHPHIVELYDMGEDDGVGLYLVFEYAAGETLKQRLSRGPLSFEGVGRLARELGDALSTAHEAGVLHRDVKPENVILVQTGSKMADFGIARIPESTLTREGGLLGTPAYSAPEAIERGTFSARSDQFSLAALLYEALAGRRAFPGDDAIEVATRIQLESVAPTAERLGLPSLVDDVLARALAKDPLARFSSCRQLGEELAAALLPAHRASFATLPDRMPRSSHPQHVVGGRLALASGAFALGAVLGAAFLPGLIWRPRAPVPPAPVMLACPEPSVTVVTTTAPSASASSRRALRPVRPNTKGGGSGGAL